MSEEKKRGGRPVVPKEIKPVQKQVRLLPDDIAEIERRCKRLGLHFSTWVRMAIRKELERKPAARV